VTSAWRAANLTPNFSGVRKLKNNATRRLEMRHIRRKLTPLGRVVCPRCGQLGRLYIVESWNYNTGWKYSDTRQICHYFKGQVRWCILRLADATPEIIQEA